MQESKDASIKRKIIEKVDNIRTWS